jgi:hypothetical protein
MDALILLVSARQEIPNWKEFLDLDHIDQILFSMNKYSPEEDLTCS